MVSWYGTTGVSPSQSHLTWKYLNETGLTTTFDDCQREDIVRVSNTYILVVLMFHFPYSSCLTSVYDSKKPYEII